MELWNKKNEEANRLFIFLQKRRVKMQFICKKMQAKVNTKARSIFIRQDKDAPGFCVLF